MLHNNTQFGYLKKHKHPNQQIMQTIHKAKHFQGLKHKDS